jgi:hypothetical protein
MANQGKLQTRYMRISQKKIERPLEMLFEYVIQTGKKFKCSILHASEKLISNRINIFPFPKVSIFFISYIFMPPAGKKK